MVHGGIQVRDAVSSDMMAIQAIYAYHVLNGSASFEEAPPSADEMAGRRDAVLKAGLPYLVAELQGHVVGYAYATASMSNMALTVMGLGERCSRS
jgi:L-amino acid N-acyltransferase YncA